MKKLYSIVLAAFLAVVAWAAGTVVKAEFSETKSAPSYVEAEDSWVLYGEGTVSGDFFASLLGKNPAPYTVKVYQSKTNANLIRVDEALSGYYTALGLTEAAPAFVFDVTDKANVSLLGTEILGGQYTAKTFNQNLDNPNEAPFRATFAEEDGTAAFTFPAMCLIGIDATGGLNFGNTAEGKITITLAPKEDPWVLYGEGTVSGDFFASGFGANNPEYTVKLYRSKENSNLIRVDNALAGVYAAKGMTGDSPSFVFDVTDKANVSLIPVSTGIEYSAEEGMFFAETMNMRSDFGSIADCPAEYRASFTETANAATFDFPTMSLILVGETSRAFGGLCNWTPAKITITLKAEEPNDPNEDVNPVPEPDILKTVRGDIPNWMSYLPDDMFVAHVSIPGTHDAATGHEWETAGGVSMSTTQCTTLDEQLENGIRAFDFRPGLKTGTDYLVCAHGIHFLKLHLDEAFKKLTDFLDAHPKEFFVIHLFRGNVYREGEGSNNSKEVREKYNALFDELFNKGELNDYLIDYAPDLTVKDIRGKIVVFRRDRIDFAHIAKAGNLTGWPGDKEQWSKDRHTTAVNATHPSVRGELYVTDVSSPKRDELNIELTSITDLYNFSTTQATPNEEGAKGPYRPYWVMCFTSGEYAGSGTSAYLNNAVETNPHLTSLIIKSEKKGPVGVVFSDWVLTEKHVYNGKTYEVKGDKLVKAILENNFYYTDRFTFDSSVFVPADGENNWDDSKQYYMKNVATGKLLSSGATWGTHAVLGDYGVRVVPIYDKYTNKYVFATTMGNGHIGTDDDKTFFVDYAATSEFTAEKVDGTDNVYVLHLELDGAKVFTAEKVSGWIDGTEYMVEPREYEAGNALQQWELVPVDEYLVSLYENLPEGESADLTNFMEGHHTWPNDNMNWTGTTATNSTISHEVGVDTWEDKDVLIHCHNTRQANESLVQNTVWTISKEFANLPAGHYTLKFHAAENNLGDKEGFSMKINGTEVKEKVAAANTNKAADVIKLFREQSDKYTVSHDFKLDENEPLKLEFTNGEVLGTEACLFLDNFVLNYHGKNGQSGIALPDAELTDGPVDVYSVAGILLRQQVARPEAVSGLTPGIYIVRTATTATKVIVK